MYSGIDIVCAIILFMAGIYFVVWAGYYNYAIAYVVYNM